MNFFYIILIIWNVQIIKTKIFELPFKTFYNTTEINMTNYMAINFKSRIGIEIELGTPPQKLNASFHLQLFYTIVQTTETKCKLTSLFNSYKSILTNLKSADNFLAIFFISSNNFGFLNL